MKCHDSGGATYPLEEVHEGIADQHLEGRVLARKLPRPGYYWPTIKNDAMEYVRRCGKYQKYGDVFNAPSSELGALSK